MMEGEPLMQPKRGAAEETVAGEEDLLMRAWQEARGEALKRCAGTLARLRAGDGGFYQAEDFMQDLFIEFEGLFRRWHASPEPDHAQLMADWRRLLWGGGIRVLRRVPQRLWSGAEWAIEPGRLALDEGALCDQGDGGATRGRPRLPRSAMDELTQSENAEASWASLTTVRELEAALFALRPLQRQVIFMSVVQALPAATVADRLGLSGRNSVYQRVSAARAALRRQLDR